MEKVIADFKSFFESLGWATNLFGILGPIGAGWLFIRKSYFFRKHMIAIRYHSIQEYIQKSGLNNESSCDPKKLRILILDDEPQNYPISYLKNANYDVDSIKEISLSEIDKILKYHVIILDITGVIKEDLKQGGFELLKRLKKNKKPLVQAVIAASSKRFDINMTEFFELADSKTKTPVEPIDMEGIIEEAVKKKFKIGNLAEQIDCFLKGSLDYSAQKKITSDIILYLQGQVELKKLKVSPLDNKEELLAIVKLLGDLLNYEKNI